MNKNIPKKKKHKKAKWLSEKALQIAEERREVKSREEKEKYIQLNVQFQRITRRDKKAFFNEQHTKKRKTVMWERLDISSRILEISRKHLVQGWV